MFFVEVLLCFVQFLCFFVFFEFLVHVHGFVVKGAFEKVLGVFTLITAFGGVEFIRKVQYKTSRYASGCVRERTRIENRNDKIFPT